MIAVDEEIKQVVIVRTDLEMGKGKLASQVGHAVMLSYLEALKLDREVVEQWLGSGEKKIVLKIEVYNAMKKLYDAFRYKKIPCALVNDAGLTQLPPGTATALGIGPWRKSEIDQFTSSLKLL